MKKTLVLLFTILLLSTVNAATSPGQGETLFFYSNSSYQEKQLICIDKQISFGIRKKTTLIDRISLKIAQKIIKKKLSRHLADEPKESKTLGILSVVTSGIGLILLFAGTPVFLIFSLAGIILGIIGLKNKKKTMALIGLIVGGVSVLLILIALLAFSIY